MTKCASHKLLIFIVLISISCSKSSEDKVLLIAVAANMQIPMQELVTEFERINDINCELSIASSGKLAAQIQQGAPFDLFISADTIFTNRLFKNELTTSEPKIYAYGELCLCTINSNKDITFSHQYFKAIDKLAIANPAVAPYGRAAVETLKKVYPSFEENVIYGESIGQTALFVRSGGAESGILAASMKRSVESFGGKCIEINEDLYTAIAQAVAIVKNSSNPDEALKFQNFLLSEQGKEILDKFGYSQ